MPSRAADDDGETISGFPAYKGKTLNEIAVDDRGLLYLDWLAGHLEESREMGSFYQSLKRFLARPHIARELELAIQNKPQRPAADPKPKPWWEQKR